MTKESVLARASYLSVAASGHPGTLEVLVSGEG